VATHLNHRSPYLAVATYVPQGSVISPADLTEVSLTPESGLAALPARESSAVLGRRASEPLQPGSLLVAGDVTSEIPLPATDALVGTSLATNQAPIGLEPGDSVIVVLGGQSSGLPSDSGGTSATATPSSSRALGGGTSPAGVLSGVITVGTVYTIALPSAGGPAGASGDEIVTLRVPRQEAAEVTAASAASDVSLAEIPAQAPS